MKNIIFIFALLILPLMTIAQSKSNTKNTVKFSIIGCYVGGNVTSFLAQLKTKGCAYQYKDKETATYVLEGKINDNKAQIYVFYDEASKLVYKVKARIHSYSISNVNEYFEMTDNKYGAYVVDSLTNLKAYQPFKTYSNDIQALVVDVDGNPNGTCYVNLTYYNIANLKKKIRTDFATPSLELTKNQYVAQLKKRGKMIKPYGYYGTYDTDLLGMPGQIHIDYDGNNRIDKVIYSIIYYLKDDSDKRNLYNTILKGLDLIYGANNREKEYSYYRYYLPTIQITYNQEDVMLKITYIRLKNQPKGSDI